MPARSAATPGSPPSPPRSCTASYKVGPSDGERKNPNRTQLMNRQRREILGVLGRRPNAGVKEHAEPSHSVQRLGPARRLTGQLLPRTAAVGPIAPTPRIKWSSARTGVCCRVPRTPAPRDRTLAGGVLLAPLP